MTAPDAGPELAPDWRPLEHLFRFDALSSRANACALFMAMGPTTAADPDDAGRPILVHCYKHTSTRRYLNLSADGRAWRYEPDAPAGRRYIPENLEQAMRHVTRNDPKELTP